SACLSTLPEARARIAKARLARTKAMLTSSTPHHLGHASLSFTKPPTTGNAEDMKNTTAAAMASGRSHRDCGLPVKGVAMRLAGRLVGSVAIGSSSIRWIRVISGPSALELFVGLRGSFNGPPIGDGERVFQNRVGLCSPSGGPDQGYGCAAKKLTAEVPGRFPLLPARPPHGHQDRLRLRTSPSPAWPQLG